MGTRGTWNADRGTRNLGGGVVGRGAGLRVLFRVPRSAFRIHPALLFLCLLAVAAFPAAASADALDDRVREIAKGLRCPVCSGETVADSNAPLSVQMRGIIREKLVAGESPDQIRAYFVTRYGPEILLTPQASGFTLGVWIMPIVALVVGLLVVLAVLRSWSRRGPGVPAVEAPESEFAADALPPDDDARLERELSRFRRERVRDGGVGG